MNALKLVNQQLLKDKIPTLLNSLKLLKRVIIESEYIMCVWERERVSMSNRLGRHHQCDANYKIEGESY